MGKADFYRPGGYNQICDRTGFKVKDSWTRKEWTGNTVRTQSWEERHPQDLIRSVQDRQHVDDPNPEPADNFLTDNEVVAGDL
jgi:hypothetical protein